MTGVDARAASLPPLHLYKYRSIFGEQREWAKDIVANSRLYWTAPAQFNDPFDCQPVMDAKASKLRKEAYARRTLRQFGRHLSKKDRKNAVRVAVARPSSDLEAQLTGLQQQLRTQVGICSLAARPDDTLMWTHYSDAHRGICLEFDAHAEQGPNPFFLAYPVIYTADRPVLNLFAHERDASLIDKVLLSKADYWAYEREWRLVDQRGGPGLHAFAPAALTAVILGAAISDFDRDEVLEWCSARRQPVEIKRARMDDRHYRLVIEPVGQC